MSFIDDNADEPVVEKFVLHKFFKPATWPHQLLRVDNNNSIPEGSYILT